MDRFAQFGLAAAEQALEQSKLQLDKVDRERIGVYVGSGIGGIHSLIHQVNVMNERGPGRVSPSLVPMMISNAAAAQISIRLGALGPSLSLNRMFDRKYIDWRSILCHSEWGRRYYLCRRN